MRRHSFVSALAGFASLAAIAAASPALAGSVSFVSAKGSDNGNCGVPISPCRTFAYALTQTNASGEIKVLDPGFYNPVTITKSVTITGVPGASIAMIAANTAITIDAGANGIVNLRGIEINGQGIGLGGISVITAKAVNIVDCVVRRVTENGISVTPSSGSGSVSATISNTISSNNGNLGMQFAPLLGGSVKASIDHSTTNDNGFAGVLGSSGAVLMITDSNADNNIDGFRAWGNSTVMRLGRNVAIGNVVGINNVNSSSTVQSYGDNKVVGNGSNSSGAIVTIANK